MHKVAIIGAGIGGSYLSYCLSKAGVDTIIFDFRAPHEKLCGGGISYKTIERFPVIKNLSIPKKEVFQSVLISPRETSVTIDLKRPLTIFNRVDLDYSLLTMAQKRGAHFKKEKVRSFAREGNYWRIFTKNGDYKAEILVGADGALSRTRKKLNELPVDIDYFFSLECFFNTPDDIVTFKFFPDIQGYLWVFPRLDSLAVGIVSNHSRKTNYRNMQERLLQFLKKYYPEQTQKISLQGAYIPLFCAGENKNLRICGNNWALIGDAATFVDPVSGEGMYYAIYSAEILAQCIRENELAGYRSLCMKYFGRNLLKALQSLPYFYRPEFLEVMIQLAVESLPVRRIISNMMTGNLHYGNWKGAFKKEMRTILKDFILNPGLKSKREVLANLYKLSSKIIGPFQKTRFHDFLDHN